MSQGQDGDAPAKPFQAPGMYNIMAQRRIGDLKRGVDQWSREMFKQISDNMLGCLDIQAG